MDQEIINKYLGQFNPILVVPVLSAVVGAILVFVFGFKRPHEPRFQSASSSDGFKKSRKKNASGKPEATTTPSPAPSASPVKVSKKVVSNENVSSKKTTVNAADKTATKKKPEEKKAENSSPAKKATAKKAKESPNANAANKKSAKPAKQADEKPADYDDGGWFTVQSKSSKKNNKTDDAIAPQERSPKKESSKKAPSKTDKSDKKSSAIAAVPVEPVVASAIPDIAVAKEVVAEVAKTNNVDSVVPAVVETDSVTQQSELPVKEVAAPAAKPKPPKTTAAKNIVEPEPLAAEQNSVVFDELGEWTEAKPDRKKNNKKKSRKD